MQKLIRKSVKDDEAKGREVKAGYLKMSLDGVWIEWDKNWALWYITFRNKKKIGAEEELNRVSWKINIAS